jgi:hypothetical protein
VGTEKDGEAFAVDIPSGAPYVFRYFILAPEIFPSATYAVIGVFHGATTLLHGLNFNLRFGKPKFAVFLLPGFPSTVFGFLFFPLIVFQDEMKTEEAEDQKKG